MLLLLIILVGNRPDAYFGILFVLFTLIVGLWAWIMAIPRSAASPR